MVGVPASGKSTFAQQISEENNHIHIFSSDRLRGFFGKDEEDQSVTKQVFDYIEDSVESYFCETNFSPLIDATNINKKLRSRFIDIAKKYNKEVIVYYFPISLARALKRNQQRERKVPEFVIKKMIDSLDEPCYSEGINQILILKENV